MVEMHSLLIGEGATAEECEAIQAALERTEHVDRVIHLRTQYLGPEEMLVAAKIALAADTDLATVAATINAAEAASARRRAGGAGHLSGTGSRSRADTLAVRRLLPPQAACCAGPRGRRSPAAAPCRGCRAG